MRPLKGIELFTKQKAPLYRWDARSGLAFSSSGNISLDSMLCESLEFFKLPIGCSYISVSRIKGKHMHRRRMQNFLSLEYITQGSLFIRNGASGYVAERGDLCILKPFMDHDLYHHDLSECCFYGFILKGRKILDMLRLLGLDQIDAVCLKNEKALMAIRTRLRDSLGNQPMDAEALRKNSGLAFELLSLVAESCNVANYSPMTKETLHLMEEGAASRLDMKSLAARFQCSPPTFRKRFEADVGETPYQHLIKIRLSKAAELLRNSSEPVKEIALLVGYANPFHFSTEFRNIYGVSPSAYRNWPSEDGGKQP